MIKKKIRPEGSFFYIESFAKRKRLYFFFFKSALFEIAITIGKRASYFFGNSEFIIGYYFL